MHDIFSMLQDYCASRQTEMLSLLERIVLLNSYTWNKTGADAVGAILCLEMQHLGLHVERIKHHDVGDTLVARTEAARAAPDMGQILFCGHLDTVFPPEMGFSCFEQHGETIRGPGVIDMKGGLVCALSALAALHHQGVLHSLPITYLINADEEVGSPRSTLLIQQEAARSSFAFVFECGGLQGQVVTARKGKHGFELQCKGQAGHVGQAGAGKPSAIVELAHKIISIESLNAYERGITCNVGQVKGGTSPNTVPEEASATVDCRFVTAHDAKAIKQSIEAIVKTPVVPNVRTQLRPTSSRPPMEASAQNRRLFTTLSTCAAHLQLSVLEERRGGVSDANTIAATGVPVLDGLGPCGDRDHSADEYMVTRTLWQRAALASIATLACWNSRI